MDGFISGFRPGLHFGTESLRELVGKQWSGISPGETRSSFFSKAVGPVRHPENVDWPAFRSQGRGRRLGSSFRFACGVAGNPASAIHDRTWVGEPGSE